MSCEHCKGHIKHMNLLKKEIEKLLIEKSELASVLADHIKKLMVKPEPKKIVIEKPKQYADFRNKWPEIKREWGIK